MAFKMKGSPAKMGRIRGTAAHKASMARVEAESIVAQTRTSGDPSLVSAGRDLGESRVPGEVDYSVRYQPKILDPKKKKKTPKEDDVMGCMDSTAENYNASATKDDGSCISKGVMGCTDSTAKNYDSTATVDDGSCVAWEDTSYKTEEELKKNGNGTKKNGKGTKKNGKGTKILTNIAKVVAAPVVAVAAVIESLGDEVADGLKDLENNIKKAKDAAKNKAEAKRVEKELLENSKVLKKIKVQTIQQQKLLPDKPLKHANLIPPKPRVDADDNPNYKIKGPTYDVEGQMVSPGGVTMNPGYNYNPGSDSWTYNDHVIRESEVSSEAYIAIMNNVIKTTDGQVNVKVEDTQPVVAPSTEGTDKEITSRNKPKIKIDISLLGTPKPNPKDYKTSREYMLDRMAWYKANPNG